MGTQHALGGGGGREGGRERERALLLHLGVEVGILLDAFWVPEEELVTLGGGVRYLDWHI